MHCFSFLCWLKVCSGRFRQVFFHLVDKKRLLVVLSYPQSWDSQGQETFLAPSAAPFLAFSAFSTHYWINMQFFCRLLLALVQSAHQGTHHIFSFCLSSFFELTLRSHMLWNYSHLCWWYQYYWFSIFEEDLCEVFCDDVESFFSVYC